MESRSIEFAFNGILNFYLLIMDFTIVCLSYNRPEALKQLISYYSNSSIHLIIADGSTTPFELPKKLDSKNSNFIFTYLLLSYYLLIN